MLKPADVIDGASVPSYRDVYVLGAYDSRITLFSQQVRALELAHALRIQDYLPEDAKIAVIGGGAAGVTIAGALALSGPCDVTVFERSDVLMPLQRGASRRRIDPHLYDWPNEDTTHAIAELPLLDWRSGQADEVRGAILTEFGQLRAIAGQRLDVRFGHSVTSIDVVNGGYRVNFERSDQTVGSLTVNAVVLAFGFGLEQTNPIANTQTGSYWEDGGVPGPAINGALQHRYFVSGNGDGGLIDLVAAASVDFDHDATIRAIISQPGIGQLKDRLRQIDISARLADASGQPFDFVAAYDEQIQALADELGLIDLMVQRLRPGVQLIFQTQFAAVMSVKTSALNRLAAYLVIKAAERKPGASFLHVACEAVTATHEAGAAQGQLTLHCGPSDILADKVVARRGPLKAAVRAPFLDILDGFQERHDRWLARFSSDTLVPKLSDAARAYFRQIAISRNVPAPVHRQAEMAAHAPLRIQIQRVGDHIRWTGDIPVAHVDTVWDLAAREIRIISASPPSDLGRAAFAIARLSIHTDSSLVMGHVSNWRHYLEALTIDSAIAEDLGIPRQAATGGEGAILNPETLTEDQLLSQISTTLDRWVLTQVDAHLQPYWANGEDAGHKIGFVAEVGLRQAMSALWAHWKADFDGSPALLGRYLRLVVCATDTDSLSGEASVLVGPRKLKSIIRAVAASLAVAAAWPAMGPHNARPGNLLRTIDEKSFPGHACAADMIDGEMMMIGSARFMWGTHFVVLPMLNRSIQFAELADASFTTTDSVVPRLTDSDGRATIVLSLDETFVFAVTQGTQALAVLLSTAEDAHFQRLQAAIELEAV